MSRRTRNGRLAVYSGPSDTTDKDMADISLSPWELLVFLIRNIFGVVYTAYLIVLEIVKAIYPPAGKSLKEQHVLITGAGGALGRELALAFAREGCQVTCVDVNTKECEETASLTKTISKYSETHTRSYHLDVTDRSAITAFAKGLEAEGTPVDILVNNAGIVQAGGLFSVTDEQINKIIDVNLMAHFWTIRAFVPTMIARNRGHVVGISSAAALAVASNIAPYTASKAGVSAVMGCLREELRKLKLNIFTTTVQPFFLAPPQNKKHWEVKSVFPEITAAMVAASTVQAVKLNTVTLTVPTYMFFLMYTARILPALASDLWRDLFRANIDALGSANEIQHAKTVPQ